MVTQNPITPPSWLHDGWLKALACSWVAALLAWLAVGADLHLRAAHQDRAAASLAAGLHLTAPAFFPSGHPWRHPESQVNGIVADHSPGLLPLGPEAQWISETLPTWEPLP